jgi:CHAD domain-containing protein/CYTH domain-containing protein
VKAPPGLLDLPAERGARRLALGLLDEAGEAHARLERGSDDEALHDFRVAIRRLRSLLRAYGPELAASVGKGARKRLEAIAAATTGARDSEVQAAWLRSRHDSLSGGERAAARALLKSLEHDRERATESVRREALRSFARERWKLARRLRFYRVQVDLDAPPSGVPLASVLARRLVELATLLETRLDAIRGVDDQERAHRARIAAKRLRYLVDPFVAELEGAPELVKGLKRLQDALGDMHDVEGLLARVGELAPPETAGEDESPDAPGGEGLRQRLEAERAAHFGELQGQWLHGAGAAFFALALRVAASAAGRGEPDREIERKYLLKRKPAIGKLPHTVLEVDQGYIPGERLAERVRRVRSEGSERYYRTVKLGRGVSRVELEEETTAPIFRRLWPLTRGRRVRKLRYRVPQGGFVWEIDRFRDRSLVLCEVELPTENTHAEPPPWLRRELVREVTSEDAYANINLAR